MLEHARSALPTASKERGTINWYNMLISEHEQLWTWAKHLRVILSVAGKDPDTRMDEGTDLSLALILTENLENSNFSVHRTWFIQLESKNY